jgi:hypothetical protein
VKSCSSICARRRSSRQHRVASPGSWGRPCGSHGLHFLALTDERGRLIWISAARPGRTHDITAARHDHIVEHLKAAGRAPVEHGFAHLKTWRILTKLRTSPARATNLLRALLVLTNLELDR